MDSSQPPHHHRKHLTNGGRGCSVTNGGRSCSVTNGGRGCSVTNGGRGCSVTNLKTHMKRDSFPVPRRGVSNPCTPPAPPPKPEQSIHPKRRSGLPPLPPRFKQRVSHLSVPSPVKAAPCLSSQETVTPDSVRLRRMKECMKEMRQRLDEVLKDGEKDGGEEARAAANDVKVLGQDDLGGEDYEERVSVDWGERFISLAFKCPCGKGHELLLSENHWYYRPM